MVSNYSTTDNRRLYQFNLCTIPLILRRLMPLYITRAKLLNYLFQTC